VWAVLQGFQSLCIKGLGVLHVQHVCLGVGGWCVQLQRGCPVSKLTVLLLVRYNGEAEQLFCFVTVMGVGPRLSASVYPPQDTMSYGAHMSCCVCCGTGKSNLFCMYNSNVLSELYPRREVGACNFVAAAPQS
jgi:hypothetical protein